MKQHWASMLERVRPGASLEEIKKFSAVYRTHLPEDLCDYFRSVDGMDDGETDNFLLHFFPLKAVKPVTDELAQVGGIPDYRLIEETLPHAELYFVFADYMIGLHKYAIRLSSDKRTATPIICICGSKWQVVAETFSEFCEKYFANPAELLIAVI